MSNRSNNRFWSAFAVDRPWKELTKLCLAQLSASGAAGNLGFLYVTDPISGHLDEVLALLREQTGITNWTGSVGLGICTPHVSIFERPGIAVMVADLPDNSFHIFGPLSRSPQLFDSSALEWMKAAKPAKALVHCDPRRIDASEIIAAAGVVSSANLVGGLSSARQRPMQIANTVVEGGISGALLTANVPITIGITQGCSPIGPRRTITRANGNTVLEIDNQPALDVFRTDIGELQARDIRRAAGQTSVGIPLSDDATDEYIVRYIIEVDNEHKSLAISQPFAEGSSLFFCRRDAQSATVDFKRMLKTLKLRLGSPPKGGLYFNCIGRGPAMFGPDFEEMNFIHEILGEFPIVGFYANGEIAYNRLYQYTGILMVFT